MNITPNLEITIYKKDGLPVLYKPVNQVYYKHDCVCIVTDNWTKIRQYPINNIIHIEYNFK